MRSGERKRLDLFRMYVSVDKGRIFLPPATLLEILKDPATVTHIRKILLKRQKSLCKICGKHQLDEKKAFHVDHNHKTGEIRGALCSQCNTILGMAGDNSQILAAAIEYLKETSSIGSQI